MGALSVKGRRGKGRAAIPLEVPGGLAQCSPLERDHLHSAGRKAAFEDFLRERASALLVKLDGHVQQLQERALE